MLQILEMLLLLKLKTGQWKFSVIKSQSGVIFVMSKPTQETKQPKTLELGDFACPRYLAKNTEQAIARGFVYQTIQINELSTIVTVQKVSSPSREITASRDFFISLEEEETDA
ncbi:MAG TPA: hypothetical protein V6D37_08990 [Candidatus Sericytochromatia bacterium]